MNPTDPGGARRGEQMRGALLGLCAALPAALLFRGFTVDDALVTARVASSIAAGLGQRFNPGGPEVDAVTPLGFAHLLALGGSGDPLRMLERARWLGWLAWLAAAALLGALLPRSFRGRALGLGVVSVSAPLAAWSSAGMETGLVTLLATLSLVRGRVGALGAGLAAGLRPELLPFAVVLAAGDALRGPDTASRRARELALSLALALGPAAAAAALRTTWFGAAAPLSLLAKPSDLAQGARYAAGAFLLTGAPLLLVAPRALLHADGATRVLVAAIGAHFAALVLAGGDWMALYRLAVPVLPAAALAGARLGERSSRAWLAVRAALAVAVSGVLALLVGWPARSVLSHRLDLIARAKPALGGSRSIACLDIGWVGAATPARLLDFAGITDPLVARLPGGHTSKRIDEGLLEQRDVDTVILLLAPGAAPASPWQASSFARRVEQHVASLPVLESFVLAAELRLGGTAQTYVVAKRPGAR